MTEVNGIKIEELVQLELDIKEHFGSFNMFSMVTHISYRRVLDMFNKSDFDKSDFREFRRLLTFVSEGDSAPFVISEEERRAIRLIILTNFNSYTAFCMKHGEYDVVYITNVVKGNLKRKTKKFKKFATFLKTKYNLKYENN